MASAVDLPPELSCRPMPFVVLTGLDVTYNAVHKSIWDAFSNNRRNERLQISFSCLPGDHTYPQSKAKRSSYDWYIPKGLLKTGWLKKHLSQVPAVVVVFFELDWDDGAWREQYLACASRVQVVRTSLHGRTTKVAVVLIQKSSPLPPGEDLIAAERAAALCSACDLSAKSLFVLPHTDHLLGYITRLESAFYELAQAYYHTECRRVKAHKEFLNKTTHQLLFPRHQFKIAFFNEQMQESATALKHYHQCYNHIHELRLHDTNNLELKMVGGFVNYKICRLCFLSLSAPVDAISQFQRHVELFKPLCGNNELLFEHSAWLSKQFLVFGDLFNEAIQSENLTAVQTQHPGFYYQQAACYALLRKKLAHSLCRPVSNQPYPANDPLESESLEYYGQRPWRQSHQRIDLSDTSREKEGILALKLREAKFDHSWQIIPLLSSAVALFKKFPCPRLKRYLTIQMAKEYRFAKDFSKAIALLQKAKSQYQSGRWCHIFTQLLALLLDCAYCTADVNLYCAFSSELLGRYSQITIDEKTKIQENLISIISGKVPKRIVIDKAYVGEVRPEDHDPNQAHEVWKEALDKPAIHTSVDVVDLVPFIECKVLFSQEQYPLDSCALIHLHSILFAPQPVQVSELTISFNHSVYDITKSFAGDEFRLEPWKVKSHSFEFPFHRSDVLKSIEVEKLTLSVFSSTGSLTLKWPGSKLEQVAFDIPSCPRNVQASCTKWSAIPSRRCTTATERACQLQVDVKHMAPALVGEVFPMQVCIFSKESDGILAENVTVLASLEPSLHQEEELFQDTCVSLTAYELSECNSKTAELKFGDLHPGEELERVIYVKANTHGTLKFTFQTSYSVRDVAIFSCIDSLKQLKTMTCSSSASTEVSFDVLPPFKIASHVTSKNFETASSIVYNKPFFVLTTLTLGSNWPIQIFSTQTTLPSESGFSVIGGAEGLNGVLYKDESLTDCLNVICNNSTDRHVDNTSVGYFKVEWQRLDKFGDVPRVLTTLKLPNVTAKLVPLHVNASLPSFAVLREAFQISFSIENQSNESRLVEIQYLSSDAFMFAGPKQTNNFLSPFSTHSLTFNIIPLALGYQTLPHLRIMMSHSHASVDGKFEDVDLLSLPTHLIVKPAQYND
ncbi:trafficking protein particle complex subunit 11-like [Clavelina lepadiformis]|uniref:trafficking protein particle complex subunit 11-like n=1 Tax=Clavelina lepadiformis TaxID=159417 RepID=UPI004043101A